MPMYEIDNDGDAVCTDCGKCISTRDPDTGQVWNDTNHDDTCTGPSKEASDEEIQRAYIRRTGWDVADLLLRWTADLDDTDTYTHTGVTFSVGLLREEIAIKPRKQPMSEARRREFIRMDQEIDTPSVAHGMTYRQAQYEAALERGYDPHSD